MAAVARAGKMMKGDGYGVVIDIILGIVGCHDPHSGELG
jgi:uncharacterized membrane protein YeaQ/YmgE (transglycosylase-associated protein family)